jgi:hypothetical protein
MAATLAIAPAVLAAWYIHAYGVNAAHWDHLTSAELFDRYYSGRLTFDFLLRPHFEHAKLFPRLVALALGVATRFNNPAEMYFQWVLICVATAILATMLRMRVELGGAPLLLALSPITLVLFSPRHHEAMLVGDGMITYLALTASLATLALLAGGTRPRPLAAAAAAFVASFSHANGFLLWPLGATMIAVGSAPTGRRRQNAFTLLVWALLALAAVVLYVQHWPDTAHAGLSQAAAHPRNTVAYAMEAAGVSFGQSAPIQFVYGALAMCVEAAIVAAAVRRWQQHGTVPFGVWLIAFAIGAQALIALGRASLETGVGVPSRYAAFVGLALIGSWMAALELRDRKLAGAALVGLVMAGALGDAEGLASGPRERDRRLLARQALRTIEWQRDSDLAELVYPFPVDARRYAAMLRRWHLNVFAEAPENVDAIPVGHGGEIHIDRFNWAPLDAQSAPVAASSDAISFSGWAVDTRQRAEFRGAYVRIQPSGVTLPIACGLARPDVVRVYGLGRTAAPGFAGIFSAGAALRSGANTLTLEFVSRDSSRRVLTLPFTVTLRESPR